METLLDRARQAGMAVMLDACIGRERFHSIAGSTATLARFAQLCEAPAVSRNTLESWAALCERGDVTAVAAAIRRALGE
ncbi:hypothetical protein BTHE68_49820 [Burkholderia sp. THE68]|jgi:hypothetical protein|uniref:hypothetical protein n=1 Tax=Burkholderiaceae TaxID=119060 RepID=UPI001316A19F|nr:MULTISPECIES: hypothetical protein [Burkholderiaceae]BBU31248.1 hypothetical protein BTHE68_49820 [Burkholderia sp. THE68]BCQ26365.1 hypothetical protein NK8_45490 [Caballeronia sp. NK8]